MVNKPCFIADCSSKRDGENGRVAFFGPPKKFFKQWGDIIPKKGLLPGSRLCSLHFDDDDIIKGKLIGDVFYEQQLWRLKTGALPKHFLGTPYSKRKQHLPLQNVTTTQGDSAKKKSIKGHRKPIQSILGSASQQASMNGGKLFAPLLHLDKSLIGPHADTGSSAKRDVMDNVIIVDMLSALRGEEASFVNPTSHSNEINSRDCPPSVFSSTEPRHNDAEMTDSSIESDIFDTVVESVENDPLENSVSFSPKDSDLKENGDRDESLLMVSSTEPGYEIVDMTDSSVEEDICDNQIEQEFFQEVKAKVDLPSDSWSWVYNELTKSAVCISWLFSPDGSLNIKTVGILSKDRVSFHIGERTVLLPLSSGTYHSFDQLSDLIATFHRQKPCRGILNPEFKKVLTEKCSVYKDGEVLRSLECTYLAMPKSSTWVCKQCALTIRCLRRRSKKPNDSATTRNRKLDAANKKIRRMNSRQMILTSEMKNLQLKYRSLLTQVKNKNVDAKRKKESK